jgi:Protein of unknown function (DUF3307)
MMTWLMVLLLLVAAHAVVDFSLQSDTMAINKSRKADTPLQKFVPWYYWLGAHALQHGGAVVFITGSFWLGLAETICHFCIDYAKTLGKYSIHVDQLLHFVCKVVWVIVWIFIK